MSVSILAAALLQTATPPQPCLDSELHRAFDFWVGDWNVYATNGNFAGQNTIEAGSEGCVLHEHWTNAQGGSGHSLNFVHVNSGQWRQIWVGNSYQIDYYGGTNVAGQMILNGKIIYERGENVSEFDFRGAWTPLDNGHVIQHFQQFDPETETWNDWSLLTYVRDEDDPNGAVPDSDATGPTLKAAPSAFE